MQEPTENCLFNSIFDGVDLKHYSDTLFLDRDGVINVLRKEDYVKNWDEFEFRKEFFGLFKKFGRFFKRVIVVTNQRGVGRGLMTEDALLQIHVRMCSEIERAGGRIDKIYYCTSTDASHPCRKPNVGMIEQAKRDFPDIDLSRSIMLGDSDSDMKFAQNAGILGIKIK